jgi:hypothetical protein
MKVIEPPAFNREGVEILYETVGPSVLGRVERLEQAPLAQTRPALDLHRLAGFALALGKTEEARRLLRLCARVMAACFEVRDAPDVTIESLWPRRHELRLSGPPPVDQTTPPDWVRAMSLAVALDDADSRNALLAHRSFGNPEGVRWDEFWAPWAETWVHALAGRTREAGHALARSLELTDPARTILPELTVLSLYVPALEILFHALTGDTEQIDGAIEKALERHRTYWQANGTDEEALLPSVLLGAVRFSDHRGLARSVDSPLFAVLPPLG